MLLELFSAPRLRRSGYAQNTVFTLQVPDCLPGLLMLIVGYSFKFPSIICPEGQESSKLKGSFSDNQLLRLGGYVYA